MLYVCLGTNSNNPLEFLPTKLSLSTRTSDFAMNNPAKANQPISNSLNVMGPNPLIYPQSFQPEEDGASSSSRLNYRDSQQQTDQRSGSTSMYDSGLEATAMSASSSIRRPMDISKSQHIERLFAAVNDKTGKIFV